MKKTNILLIILVFFGMIHPQENTNFTFNYVALSLKNALQPATFYKEELQFQKITNKTKTEGFVGSLLEKEKNCI